MSFGKHTRPQMKRTTSMTEFGIELGRNGETRPPFFVEKPSDHPAEEGFEQRMLLAAVSPRNYWRHSGDLMSIMESGRDQYFLGTCTLCKRRLIPGRDIYMYRGDSAFCSQECRQQQMKQDERKEKCSLSASTKQVSSSTAVAVARTEVAAQGETIAAVV